MKNNLSVLVLMFFLSSVFALNAFNYSFFVEKSFVSDIHLVENKEEVNDSTQAESSFFGSDLFFKILIGVLAILIIIILYSGASLLFSEKE